MSDVENFRTKIKTISFGLASRRVPKKTVDIHDQHKVEVTEHWDDRQDVNVMMQPIEIKASDIKKKEKP